MAQDLSLPRYDTAKTYAWNYDHAPDPVSVEVAPVPGTWRFCGIPVDSPLGVSAGPLLNGRWCLYYANLGFDVLTYKTVRSVERACYPLPNLQPVACGPLRGGEHRIPTASTMLGTWAVSFGMPCRAPDVWRADVEHTRAVFPRGKILSVSVVGTHQPGWTLDELADDYACCAKWAVESGADCVETNFSCPNVATCDGQLFQNPDDARTVAMRVREAVGDAPYIVKVGHVPSRQAARELVESLSPHVTALAMTNSVAATVQGNDGELIFDGQPRGICGDATRKASLEQTTMFSALVKERGLPLQIIGVGGVSSARHVGEYLAAGAHAVHIASAAMVNPAVATEIRRDASGGGRFG